MSSPPPPLSLWVRTDSSVTVLLFCEGGGVAVPSLRRFHAVPFHTLCRTCTTVFYPPPSAVAAASVDARAQAPCRPSRQICTRERGRFSNGKFTRKSMTPNPLSWVLIPPGIGDVSMDGSNDKYIHVAADGRLPPSLGLRPYCGRCFNEALPPPPPTSASPSFVFLHTHRHRRIRSDD